MTSEITGFDSSYCTPDAVWDRVIALLERSIRVRKRKKNTGRPRMRDGGMDYRKARSAIFYALRTGCQWDALPRSHGASRTVHDR